MCVWVCVGVCALMRMYEHFWGAGIRTASLLPDSLHMSIPVCLVSLASSTNKLKSIAGYLTGRYRRYQRNKWNGSDGTWMRLSVLKEQSKWKGYHNSGVYLVQYTLWYSICSLRSSSFLLFVRSWYYTDSALHNIRCHWNIISYVIPWPFI